jgi:hypothetical protein
MKHNIKIFLIALIYPLSLPVLGFLNVKSLEYRVNEDRLSLNKCLYELQSLRKVNPVVTDCNESLCNVVYSEESLIDKKISSCRVYESNLIYNEERLDNFLLYFAIR